MKRGDKVKCIDNTGVPDINIGDEYEVDEVTGNLIYLKEYDRMMLGTWRFLAVSETESTVPKSSKCNHNWKAIQGLFTTWYNCSKCDIKKEDYEKTLTEGGGDNPPPVPPVDLESDWYF